MRFVLLTLLVCTSAVLQAQWLKAPQRHTVRYAADTIFKKTPPLKTAQPSIFEQSARTMGLCNTSCAPLPVKFLSFKAERKSEALVKVEWETANEVNVFGYEVERSLGDAMHFEKIGFVAAAGASNPFPVYAFNDANRFPGTSYYRLRQLDNDQKMSYSKTVAVKGYAREERVDAFPNPAHSNLQLRLSLLKSGAASLLLFDATGRLLVQQKKPANEGTNQILLNIQHLAPGTYFIRITTPAEKILQLQFVKN